MRRGEPAGAGAGRADPGGRLLFEGVSLALGPAEAAVIRGPNGVGKSSLMRVAAGLLRASAGAVRRGGRIALADEAAALDAG
jgi:heme exporter protein A